MTPLEIALAIHDYLTVQGSYDYTYTKFDAYSMIVTRTGVCQSYALAYKYLANKMGIECELVTSDEINHAWNIVNINGLYYHVDTTWDDNLSTLGKTSHYNFMKSETKIIGMGHRGMNESYPANDTTYDDYFWDAINNQMVYFEGYWYYISGNGNLMQYSFDTKETATITHLDAFIYNYNLFGNVALYNNRLYYNSSNCIYSINPDGTDQKKVFQLDSTSQQLICGLSVYKGNLEYTLKTNPYESDHIYSLSFSNINNWLQETTASETTTTETTTSTIETSTTLDSTTQTTSEETTTTETTPQEIISGDIDGDTNITITDVVIFTKVLYGIPNENFKVENADINKDKIINIFDLNGLKKLMLTLN
jgi:hypothetical protein